MVIPAAFLAQQWHQGAYNQVGFAIIIAVSTVIVTMIQQFLSAHLTKLVERFLKKITGWVDPYMQIKFYQDKVNGGPKNYLAFAAIETYLSARCAGHAPRLMANSTKDIKKPMLCIDDDSGLVPDEFKGVKVSWQLMKENDDTGMKNVSKKKFVLNFHKKHREIVVADYLGHVMEEGKTIAKKDRQLKLYSNTTIGREGGGYWNCIMNLDHPATFDTMAMPQEKKAEILDDMVRFSQGQEYYKRIGKPWKRGYLLYGPPGTGKSTMIVAMANFLSYDVFDLELTTVSDNSTLKLLVNRIPENSILVIEDIDCSSKVTSNRETGKKEEGKKQTVTLSGLLNCIDGISSASEGGRLVVFTTNHVEDLDPALIRRGRMDKHVEMAYCGFEAFGILARNYLGIENHDLFPKIRELLKEVEITPADVAENLIRNDAVKGSDEVCLKRFIVVLEKLKEEKYIGIVKGDINED